MWRTLGFLMNSVQAERQGRLGLLCYILPHLEQMNTSVKLNYGNNGINGK